nr:amino acid adenylation domain-containing protein [Tessaracoccus bendigoensis]
MERRIRRAADRIGLFDLAIDLVDGGPTVIHDERSTGWVVELNSGAVPGSAIDDFIANPFDLARPPLFRAGWVAPASGAGLLVLVAHHSLFDGRSFDHVAAELIAEVLGVPSTDAWSVLDPSTVPWRPADTEWSDRLLPLPDHATPVTLLTDGAGATGRIVVSDEAVAHLSAVQVSTGRSRATILLALFASALHRVLDLDDLLVVIQVDVRPASDVRSLGMLVNTLPVRSQLSPSVEWSAYVDQIQAELQFAVAHRHEPLEDIVRSANPRRRSDGSSVFSDFEFSYVRERSGPRDGPLAAQEVRRPDPASRYGASMNVVDRGDEVEVRWGSRSSSDQLHGILQSAVESLLRGWAEGTGSPTNTEVVPATECAEILTLGTGPVHAVDVVSPTAHLRMVSACDPKRTAVVHGNETCTFRGLESWAAAVQSLLAEHGVGRGDRVMVSCRRGVSHVAATVAILHLGAVYVPCDGANPPERATAMARDARPTVVLVDHTAPAQLRLALGAVVAVVLDLPTAPPEEARLLEPTGDRNALDPVYILFTSGSTGRPKGVEVGLVAFLNHLQMVREHVDLRPADRVGQTAPLGFDIHVWQALVPLVGATAVVFDTELRDPEEFLAEVERLGVTVLELVPSYLRALCDLLDTRPDVRLRTAAVRHLLTTGEAFEPSLVTRIRGAFPNATITNAYGPAEAADDVTLHVLEEGRPVVPIGHPARNVELLVVDRWRRVRPMGLPGELIISGLVLANGYVVDGQLRRFGEHPYRPGERGYATGDIVTLTRDQGFVFHGRADDQVKLAGRRAELGEVESALLSLAGVKDAAVILVPGERSSGLGGLRALVVLDGAVEVADVRRRLSHLLPDFMVPSHVQPVTAIPRSPNGKLDRGAARRLSMSVPIPAGDPEATRDEVLEAVHRAWTAVLGADTLQQNFFEAGGDSLGAVDLAARLGAAGWTFSVRELYQHQTVADLVGLLRRRGSDADRSSSLSFTPTPRQVRMTTVPGDGVPDPVLALVFEEVGDVGRVVEAVTELVKASAALRVAVHRLDGGGQVSLVEQATSDDVMPRSTTVAANGDQDVLDALLVEAAAGAVDPSVGRLVATSVGDAEVCVALSHLMADVGTLVELTAALSETLEGRPSRIRTGMPAWSAELARRASAAAGLYRPHFDRVTAATHRQNAHAHGAPLTGVRHGQVLVPGLESVPVDAVPRLALAMVARALMLQSGLDEVRVDIERDGRGTLFGHDVLGNGAGCHTLLEPVLVRPSSLDPSDLLDAVDRSLATNPPAWTWDAALLAAAPSSEGPLPAVPLVNVMGRSLSLPAHPSLGARVRVPQAVAVWNSASDEHGVVVDFVEQEGGSGWVAQVTTHPAGWSWGLDGLLTEMTRSAPAFIEAIARPGRSLPRGLDLLGIEGAEVDALLGELERDW